MRDNPLSQLYLATESAAEAAIEMTGAVASGANEAARGVATILKWAPYVAAGIGAVGLRAAVLAARR